ncbi:MAG: Mov34/MPN/PAD-1 family protein [Candidatus Margulisiibacteriota bacterium]
MDPVSTFYITDRHYNLIIRQGIANYPQESGGFVGGRSGVILGVLPVFNQHLYNKTDTYGLGPEDTLRAHQFFEKHRLTCFGVYHSHPKGLPEPSFQDLKSGNKFHFIVGLRDLKNPVLFCYEARGFQAQAIPLVVITEKDLPQYLPAQDVARYHPNFESIDLSQKIEDIKNQTILYPKNPPTDPHNPDGFSTFA